MAMQKRRRNNLGRCGCGRLIPNRILVCDDCARMLRATAWARLGEANERLAYQQVVLETPSGTEYILREIGQDRRAVCSLAAVPEGRVTLIIGTDVLVGVLQGKERV